MTLNNVLKLNIDINVIQTYAFNEVLSIAFFITFLVANKYILYRFAIILKINYVKKNK